jgi:hypothetical protein
MALQFLDRRLVGAYIVDAWQNHLNTEQDPADGQWFTNGPGNNGGLYGRLTDTLASELVFDSTKQMFSVHQLAAQIAHVDNRNGLNPKSTVSLTYTYSNGSTVSHATSNALKVAAGVKITAKTEIFGAEGGVETSLSTEYSYSWTDTTSSTTTETLTFQQSVPVEVPAGRVHRVMLMCNKNEATIPFSANIYIGGTSSACFGSPVNGQKIWTADAGTICSWISQFGSAGNESYKSRRDRQDPTRGFIALAGQLTAQQTSNFSAVVLDVTETYTGDQPPQAMRAATDASALLVGGRKISETPLHN